jgi:transposase
VRAQLTRRRLQRLAGLLAEIQEVNDLIAAAVAQVRTGLTDLYGIGPASAATILGEVADVRRYRFRHAFAAANGTAPIPASSGRTSRHRLNRTGNRTLNRVLYTMAITQIRATPKAGLTTCANAPRARLAASPCAASNDACPTSSTRPCTKTSRAANHRGRRIGQ